MVVAALVVVLMLLLLLLLFVLVLKVDNICNRQYPGEQSKLQRYICMCTHYRGWIFPAMCCRCSAFSGICIRGSTLLHNITMTALSNFFELSPWRQVRRLVPSRSVTVCWNWWAKPSMKPSSKSSQHRNRRTWNERSTRLRGLHRLPFVRPPTTNLFQATSIRRRCPQQDWSRSFRARSVLWTTRVMTEWHPTTDTLSNTTPLCEYSSQRRLPLAWTKKTAAALSSITKKKKNELTWLLS